MKGDVPTITYLLLLIVTLAFVSSSYVFFSQFMQQDYTGVQNIAQNAQQFIDEAKQKYGYSTNEQVIEQQFSPQRIDTQVSEAANPSSSTTYVFAGSQIPYHDNGQIIYNHPDYMGSARLSTSEAGQKVSEERYYPFGSMLVSESDASASQRFTYTGKEHDGTSDLMYYGARYYDPDVGRFYEVDPVKNDNSYAYVSNNPLKFVDPDGKKEYAVVAGFSNVYILFDASMHISSVLYGMNQRLHFSPQDTVRVDILYSADILGSYRNERNKEKGRTDFDELKYNTYSYDIDNWRSRVETRGARLEVTFTEASVDERENKRYIDSLLQDYDEIVTISHGITYGNEFTFLDGLARVTFSEYLKQDKWLDISCGSTCSADTFSVASTDSLSLDTDSLDRRWDDTVIMSALGPEAVKTPIIQYYKNMEYLHSPNEAHFEP